MKRRASLCAGLALLLFHGFPATEVGLSADVPQYVVEDLGTIDGAVFLPAAINASGDVAGFIETSAGPRAARFVAGAPSILPGFEETFSVAQGISAEGTVAGYLSNGSGLRAFRYRDGAGTATIEPPAGGFFTQGFAINGENVVVGMGHTADGPRAIRAVPGSATEVLPTLGGPVASAYAINDAGRIAGTSVTGLGAQRAFRLEVDGTIADLGTLGGSVSQATGINEAGAVVGRSENTDGVIRAFKYTTTMMDLGPAPGVASRAEGIAGPWTVGYFVAGDDDTRAFVHTDADGLVDLNTRIPADSGWVLSRAWAVNESGQIVGDGYYNGELRGFRLTIPRNDGDSMAPTIHGVNASPAVIWPPNGRMERVSVQVSVSDDQDPSPACAVDRVTSNEPEAGDVVVDGGLTVLLRAAKSGPYRRYQLEVTCRDASNNSTSAVVDVLVQNPHQAVAAATKAQKD